jgi:hypothetical protein
MKYELKSLEEQERTKELSLFFKVTFQEKCLWK